MSRALVVGLALAAAAGCTQARYHSTVNAPGIVTLAPPARENGSPELYVPPQDPGEHELYVAPGVIGGMGVGRHEPGPNKNGAELGLYLRMAYKTTTRSHHRDDLPWPAPGWALNLGWAPLQYGPHAEVGPIHVEVERQWFLASVGLGVAVYPDDGTAGVQLTGAFKPYVARVRYMAETGFEVFAGLQLELPRAITWSR
ncbi:MAG: hypothetical protein IPL61_36270 [Myxococcales bacterium]|nr:hypothetical protein [Myxococcales bacterium]